METSYSFSTRFSGVDGSPEQGDTYTLISYGLNATTITTAQQRGYYAYDITGAHSENMVPAQMATTSPYKLYNNTSPVIKDRSYAQQLNSIPASETNPNNQGIYRTAVIHPAIPVRSAISAGLGYLPVFGISDNIWVSSPDDADGDPATNDPFEITVTSNGQVHPFPNDVRLYPIKAGLKLYFYSYYFYDTDTDKLNPRTQSFSIGSIHLVNSGSNGWYNARTGIVYPNYNYTSTRATVYSPDVTVTTPGDNYRDLSADMSADNTTTIPNADGTPSLATAQWASEDIRVFPSDYSGNTTSVMPMSIAIVLDMGTGGSNRVNIPVSFNVERGRQYTFYVNVTSEMVNILYSVSDWDSLTQTYTDIGGSVMNYATIQINKTPGGWETGGGGSSTIGE